MQISGFSNFREISIKISKLGNPEIYMETREAHSCRTKALYGSLNAKLAIFFGYQNEKLQKQLIFSLTGM